MPLARPLARPVAIVLAAALTAAACGDDGGPGGEQLTGRYALVAANNQALPLIVAGGLGGVDELTASTLAFSGNRVIEEQRYQRRTNAGAVTETTIDTVTFTYTLRDDVLVFVRSATQADTAERAGDLIAFEQTFFSPIGAPVRAAATYAKVE